MITIFFFEILVIGLGCINIVTSSHFRGGSIFWKPTGNGYEVEFSAKLGWAYRRNACSSSNLNVYQPSSIASWICVSGCPGNRTMVNANRPGFTCTGFDASQNWERTESTFSYVFPGPGPYVIEFTGGAWISELGSGNWRLTTTVDLHTRSDTLAPNFSPVVPTKPVYYVQNGCKETLRLPVSDEDGDRVTCRWSTGLECEGVCYSAGKAPVATLQTNCDLTIDASLDQYGVYALAITIKDKPTSTITIGSTPYAPSRVISSVPLQFVLLTPEPRNRSCSDKPMFLEPTPSENDVLVYKPGDTVSLRFYATSRAATIISFTLLDPPTNVRQSALCNDDRFRPDVYAMDLTWTPVAADRGSKTICVEATDNCLMSTQHCVTLLVLDINPCDSSPCKHNGTCQRQGYMDNYNCACVPGFTGHNCIIDINECASSPCQHNGTCIDLVNEFFCGCLDGYTGFECGIEMNECASSTCHHNGTCYDLVNNYSCGCLDGYTGYDCEIDIDECASSPCQHNGTCFDQVNEFICGCLDGYTGFDCGIDINECASSPCKHNGTCFDLVNEFVCGCPDGYTGFDCGIDINECASSPCQNIGTCVDLVNEFVCGCPDGYTDLDCGIDVNECDSSPCQHNGTCFDQVNEFVCGCLDGYTGFDCGIDINECASSPCQHNGTCFDQVNEFFCGCLDGYTDHDCGIVFGSSS
ncbi:protein serrate-like [Mya arenaria]|uniref:protein serrate-like n=1 Tax=Mya arenaria TaxID=6604 RepID=UPI0022E3EB9B|nr:protein serrate-like [Mya arenaria]